MSNMIITSRQIQQLKQELAQWVQVTAVEVEFDTAIVRHAHDLPFVQDFLKYSHWGDLVKCQLLANLVNNAELM